MKSRIFAILNWKKDRVENVKNEIVEKLSRRKGDKILLFYKESDGFPQCFEKDDSGGFQGIPMSEADGHNRAAGLNFVYKYLKDNFKDEFAYVIYDSIQFKQDPNKFMDSIEEMMEKLKFDVWFNTYTDPMNFVFSKFDGRVSIAINEPELMKIYNKTIIWTSHANPNLSVIDLTRFELPENGKTFDDSFEVPMFWIIKFLCERARDKKGFMNHYPTIPEEVGVYRCGGFEGQKVMRETMEKEDKMFSEFKLDHTPNQNVEALMDFMVERLKSH